MINPNPAPTSVLVIDGKDGNRRLVFEKLSTGEISISAHDINRPSQHHVISAEMARELRKFVFRASLDEQPAQNTQPQPDSNERKRLAAELEAITSMDRFTSVQFGEHFMSVMLPKEALRVNFSHLLTVGETSSTSEIQVDLGE